MDEKPLACLDAGVLVAIVPGAIDMHYKSAVRVCDAARRSGFQLITSRLAVMEMINAVRRRTASTRKCKPGCVGDLSAADAHARKAVAQALDPVSEMDQGVSLIVMEMTGKTFGFVLLHRKMPERPGRTVPGGRSRTCRHRGVGPNGGMLFAPAEEAGAPAVCTADAALADIACRGGEFDRIQAQVTGRAA